MWSKTGKPHEVTIWFVLDGDRLYIGTANVKRQRVQNCPRISQALVTSITTFDVARSASSGRMTNTDQYHVLECGIILMESAEVVMVLTIVAVIFGVFSIGLIVLLIYKSTLTMHRDDQLFLDDASSHMHEEQTELLAKVNRLTIPMRVLSIGSGVFLMVLAAMWFYQKLNAVQ